MGDSPDTVRLIEEHVAEAYRAECEVPGVEVHDEDDVTWVVHCGSAWRNSAVMVRLTPSTATRRLKTILARYERHKRGAGFWISPLSTPSHLPELLSAQGLHCRKHFPAMLRTLGGEHPPPSSPRAVEILPFDPTMPVVRSPRTALGRCEVERLRVLLADRQRRTRVLVARLDGEEVGRVELFVGTRCSGIHGISVRESVQGRGIGSALLDHACREAANAGSPAVVLLATTEGQRLYERRGFAEVARFGYWYRSFRQ